MKHTIMVARSKSTSLRIPIEMVKKSGLEIRQTVRLVIGEDGGITTYPVIERPTLDDLLASVTAENMPDAIDVGWGRLASTEAW